MAQDSDKLDYLIQGLPKKYQFFGFWQQLLEFEGNFSWNPKVFNEFATRIDLRMVKVFSRFSYIF